MLHNGHQLYVRIVHILKIRDKCVSKLVIAQGSSVLMGSPAAEMNLININRLRLRGSFFALLKPFFVLPAVTLQIPENRGCFRLDLRINTIRI